MRKMSEAARKHYKEYNKEYVKNNLRRIPLGLLHETYDRWKAYADSLGLPFNTMIKKCVEDAIAAAAKDSSDGTAD